MFNHLSPEDCLNFSDHGCSIYPGKLEKQGFAGDKGSLTLFQQAMFYIMGLGL